jgi:hypothetical protein
MEPSPTQSPGCRPERRARRSSVAARISRILILLAQLTQILIQMQEGDL